MIVTEMIIPTLETDRLVLRPLELADAEAIQALFPRWDVVQYMAAHIPWPYPSDGAVTFVRDFALPAMREGSEWHWSIRPKTRPEQLIGVVSLMTSSEANRGFWLAPEWQGRGLMSEASEVATDYWFDGLGKDVLRVHKAIANLASRRISERTGMRVVWTGDRNYVSGAHLAELWEITAEEWRARRR